MTNISEMVCRNDWSFLEENNLLKQGGGKEEKTKCKREVPINEVYDILSVSGYFKEGETDTVEFTYYSDHGMIYKAIAM